MEQNRRPDRKGIKRLQQLDLDILQGLYEYRAMSTDQIERRYRMTASYTYRKLRLLRVSGYISSHPIIRYRFGQRSQGKYHRLTREGLAVLRDRGMYVDKKLHQLEVAENLVPFLLATNDLMVDLEPYGWVLTDSREIKLRYQLNRSDNIQGTLQNVYTGSKEYGIYTYLHSISEKNLEKMVREIKNYSSSTLENKPALMDYLIFKKGQNGFNDIIKIFTSEENRDILAKVRSLKIMPYTFGKYYMRIFEDEDEILRYACSIPENDLSFKRRFEFREVNAKYSGLNCVVIHKGEEKYFVNLVDSDLKKVFDIQQYKKEDYEQDGRKVLVYVNSSMKHIHEESLNSYRHVEYLEAGTEMIDYLLHVQPIENR